MLTAWPGHRLAISLRSKSIASIFRCGRHYKVAKANRPLASQYNTECFRHISVRGRKKRSHLDRFFVAIKKHHAVPPLETVILAHINVNFYRPWYAKNRQKYKKLFTVYCHCISLLDRSQRPYAVCKAKGLSIALFLKFARLVMHAAMRNALNGNII